jgi:co-chaperonin GroES (HSP10)
MDNFMLLGERVMLKVTENDKEENVGGIVIPGTAREVENIGEVVATGNKVKEQDYISPGVKVIFQKFGGQEIEVDKIKYLVIPYEDIVGIKLEGGK